MTKTGYWWILLFSSMVFLSCSGDEETNGATDQSTDNVIENIDLPEQLGLDSGEVKMFTMPTPLQIATALKIMQVDYNDGLLLENGYSTASDIDLSLLLGMYMTDLGYTTVYNNTQKSLSYAKDVQNIMEELPISFYVNDVFRKRFSDNIDNHDSLCKIILEGYNDANQYISETENEGLGLLILTGGYIEGLYLISSSEISNKWLEEHNNIFIQQKLFLDNFILLLDGYTGNSKINTVVSRLKELKVVFDKIGISFNNEKDTYETTKPITTESRKEINAAITAIRNDVLQNVQ